MRSLGFLVSRRWILFAIVVALLAYAAWLLGEWQFHRLEDRKASNTIVERNEDAPPAPVADVLAPGRSVDEQDEWRVVEATGTYAVDDTVVVRYRTRDGASGVDVVVPARDHRGTVAAGRPRLDGRGHQRHRPERHRHPPSTVRRGDRDRLGPGRRDR